MKKISKRTRGSRKPSPKRRPTKRRAPVARPPHVLVLIAFAELAKRLHLRWYLFGAQAVNLHGIPRATADMDITVDLGEMPLADFLAALRKSGFDIRVSESFVMEARVIPAVHSASSFPIDFVLAGPGLEQRFLDEVVAHKLGRLQIPVLSAENLIVTKLLAARPRDLQDVREMVARATIDHERIELLLEEIETALDRSDLRALYRTLRTD